ncbi:SxtJ family membrane protein [Bosea sp. (in: a-proteobacteria)]|uniref:SxtJ family membrane protein n=1 Tax=Bosea sp. (in: a-proteobacteria) TaxID=1871050 RepID=UPI002FC9699C
MSKGVHHEFGAGAGHDDGEGSSDRSFGLVFAVVFALIGLYNLWHWGRAWPWLGLIAAAFLGIALIRPALLAPLNKLWMRFGMLLAAIINPIVLGILFFLVFTPMALVARLVGKDFLKLKSQPEAKSYWIVRDPPGPVPVSMKDQF